jgi:dolichol-phosphate mannosyltransferase
MRKVLLTGGTGFVGANLARRLLSEGHKVIFLVRPRFSAWRVKDVSHHIEFLECELADASAVNAAVKLAKADWVFHLAAYGAYSWQNDLAKVLEANVHGCVNLITAAADVGCEAFVNTGSSSEYGFQRLAASEDTVLRPNSCYAIAKAFSTHFCSYTAHARGLNVTTLRLYSAYGPYEDPGRLIPAVIRHGMAGSFPPMVSPEIARDFTHVDDVCAACLLAAGSAPSEKGRVFNVGTGAQTSMAEVARVAKDYFRIPGDPVWSSMPDRKWDSTTWVADPRRIKAELKWLPKWSFAEGFRNVAEWYGRNPEKLREIPRTAS